jgi:hypothetical protein
MTCGKMTKAKLAKLTDDELRKRMEWADRNGYRRAFWRCYFEKAVRSLNKPDGVQ